MKILIIVLCLLCILNLSATIINIPDDYATIQEGLNVAIEDDTILVASGTYESITWPETSGIKLIGSGAENCIIGDSYTNSPIICITILSGIIDTTTVIKGFTITNGLSYAGGGIYCLSSSPKLENLIIDDNTASFGGGIYCGLDSDPYLSNIYITNNSAINDGGGICCMEDSGPIIDNVTITENSASDAGGGIYSCNDSNPVLNNVTITYNSAGTGGGIHCWNESNPILRNVIIMHNSAVTAGGLYCRNESNLTLEYVIIENNSATGKAGGIYCFNSSIDLYNVTIIGNSTSDMGGGIYFRDTSSNLNNITFSENSAGSEGGGIYCDFDSSVNLINCILWNDSPQEIYISSDTVYVEYSNIQGGWAGIGNIDDDPLFIGSGNNPFSLDDLSTCINSGIPDTTGLNLPEFDLTGNPRIYGGRIDMGAYENQNVFVSANDNIIPNTNLLYKNYPNPFNPTTTISFSIPKTSYIKLEIYNIKGQKIKTLANKYFSQGSHSIIWNGNDESGESVSSGIYYYKLNVNGKTKAVKKCLLLK